MKRGGGLFRAFLVPGVAVVVAAAALVFQAPQVAIAIAQGCVTPGNDGPNATLTGVVNSYYPATASAAAGATTISVGTPLAGGGPAIAAGDLLLVIQMQDADINGTNTNAYGDGSTGAGSTNLRQTGKYEYVSAASAVAGGVVTIVGSGAGNGLVNGYDFSLTVTATNGFRTFQVIRVPQYSSATLTGTLTAAPWNGAVHAGGVLAIDVAGQLNLNAQTVNVDQLGFKGALGVAQGGGAGTGIDYVRPSGGGAHGYKGEGVAGTPRYLYDAINNAQVLPLPGADGYPNGDAARGAPGTAGGGGTDANPSANDQNSGGGGGANGGPGGTGGNSWNSNQPVGGRGGAAFPAAVTRVVMGGGGGAGTRNNSTLLASSGGTGGGIVMIRTGSLGGTGTITANGGVGLTPENDGGGGGGAGGSVVVTTNTGTVNGLTIHADGGRGTDAWPTSAGGAGGVNYHGPGGGGGGGVIITSNALPLAQSSVLGGVHGTTTLDLATFGSVSGSAGVVSTAAPAAIPGSSSGAECLPVLTTTKTTSTPNVNNTVAGTTAIYSITASNAASTGAAIGISISDALPAGFTYASTGSVVLNGGATRPATVNPAAGATNPAFGTFTIPGGGSVVITFTVNIAASVAPGIYNNPATATYLDPARTTVGGTISAGYAGGGGERVTVHAPDLTIAKSHVDPFTRGTTATYTITATNSGNVPTSSTVTVTDTLPAGLTPTGAAGPGWTCPAPAGQTVTCTRADVLAGASSYPAITVTVAVLQGAANSVTNTASVSGGSETNTTNDTANDPTNIVSSADIAVTKTVNNATPNVGANVTFTITATNNGPSNATGVHVSDVLPSGLTFVSASSGSYTPGTGDWIVGNLANGGSSTLTITATVTGTTAVINTATKSAEVEPDPVPGNNSAPVTVTGQSADMLITKTVDNATPNVGSQVTFTVTAKNNGPSTATGVKVTDNLPGTLTFVTSTASGTTTYSGGVWNVGTLANAASATLTITATVTSTTPTTNTATKTAEDQTDPNSSNDSDTATVTGQSADISITKTVSNPTPNFGSNVTFTVTATNNGPSTATGVVVNDLLPAPQLLFVSAAPSGPYNSATGDWTVGTLANGASSTLTIVATVNATSATTNTATKTAEDQADPNPVDDTSSATITPVAADIDLTKAVDNTRPNEGTNVTFTVTATNNGPSGATGVVVNDLLPAGLMWVSSSTGAYDHVSGDWTIGALANGANQTLTIVATATGTTPVTNTASVTAAVQPDPKPGNNTAKVTVTGQAADIAITKTVDNATPRLNTNVTFTITALNNGPNDATGVQVTDLVPAAGLTYVSSTPSAGTSYDSGSGRWDIGPLANRSSATLSIVATAISPAPVTNTATKTSEDQTDPDPTNNSANVMVTPVSADIDITKTVDNSTPTLNTNVTFTVTAHNNGPSTATGVWVKDLLPAGLVYVSSTTTAGPYDQLLGTWNVGTLNNGSTATLMITVKVTSLTNVTNTATKTLEDQVDPVTSNDSASAAVSCCTADIVVSKTVDNLTPNFGSNVTYTVTATNNGPASATGLALTDQLPVGLTYVTSTVTGGTSYDPVSWVWTIGLLPNASTAKLTITAKVNTASPVVNTARKTAENEADPTPLDDTSSATITPVAADIALTKTVDNSLPNLNSNVTFTVTATNNGPSDATGVKVSDQLPVGLNYVSSGATVGSYDSTTHVWTIGALAKGNTATLSILAKVAMMGSWTNTASTAVLPDQPDPVPGNNSAAATVTAQAADIAITKIVDNATPNLNTNVTFTITAQSNGASDATGVEITDILPTGLNWVSSATAAGTYDHTTGIWHIGGLANASTATLTIVANVTTTASVTNTATRTAGNQPDPNSANDTSSATVTGQQADIAITKTVDNPVPDVGTNVTFTVKAHNNGPSAATGVVVSDPVPVGLALVTATPSVGTSYTAGVWTIGPLGIGADATLAIVAKVTTTAQVTNTATKTAEDQPDPVTTNDAASATITPTGALADITVTKTVNQTTPTLGQNVTYTLVAHNLGSSTAPGVQLHDLLPAGVTFVSYTATQGTYDPVTGIWNVGSMLNGSTVTLSVVVTVKGSGLIVNTVTVLGGAYFDPNLSNNISSAPIDPPALPGLPNTSAPDNAADTTAVASAPAPPQTVKGILLAILTVVAGLGVLSLAGVGRRRTRARFGRRRSRKQLDRSPGRVTVGLVAGLLSMAIISVSAGDLATNSAPTVTLGPVAGTQLIGSAAVVVNPPPAPPAETFHTVKGSIIPSRLRIPAIGVDSWIGAVALRKDGSMNVPDNLWTSSWLATGPRPGQPGNAVIAGHRGVGTPALFSHLETVQPGDRIYVSDSAGNQLIYMVTRVASMDLSTSTQVAVFGPTSAQNLVLITCFGRYVPSARTYDHRLVVFSQPVSS